VGTRSGRLQIKVKARGNKPETGPMKRRKAQIVLGSCETGGNLGGGDWPAAVTSWARGPREKKFRGAERIYQFQSIETNKTGSVQQEKNRGTNVATGIKKKDIKKTS